MGKVQVEARIISWNLSKLDLFKYKGELVKGLKKVTYPATVRLKRYKDEGVPEGS